MSSRMDRIKQGQAAKERVLSGMYNQPRTTSSARSSRNARMKARQQKVSESVNNALTTGIDKITDFITSPTVQSVAQGITNEVKKNDQIAAKGMTPGLPVTPPTGFLMNKLTPNAGPFARRGRRSGRTCFSSCRRRRPRRPASAPVCAAAPRPRRTWAPGAAPRTPSAGPWP